MGNGRKGKRKNTEKDYQHEDDDNQNEQSESNATQDKSGDRDDVLAIDTDDEWLTNAIVKEVTAKGSTKRSAKKYNQADVCRLGLERVLSITKDSTFDMLPLSAVEAQLTVVNMYYQNYFKYTVNLQPLTAVEIVNQQEITEKFDHLYNNICAILEHRKIELKEQEGGSTNNSLAHNASATNFHTEIKVKKVDIEKFAGDNKKWPQFKSSFEECFHRRADINGATKFYYLISHLEQNSEAYNTISGLDRTEANYSSAWDLLCKAYDNERKIVNDIVLSFVDMPSCSEHPSRGELVAVINSTNNLLQSLPKYGVEVKHWDPILVPLLVRKLDGESIRLWSLERNQRKIASMEPLLEFIRKRADEMDAEFVVTTGNGSHSYVAKTQQNGSSMVSKRFRGPENGSSSNNSTNTNGSGDTHDQQQIKKRKGNCYHCNGPHQLYKCDSFKRMAIELREERLNTLNVCIKCLRKGHRKETCKLSNCKCGGVHNRLLCPSAVSVMSVIHTSPTVSQVDASLIATLSVIVRDEHGNSVRARAMSDGGSQVNMVTSRLVQQLKLKSSKLSVPLQGPGQCSIPSRTIVDIQIVPGNNGYNKGEWIQAGVINTISDRLPSCPFDIADWEHIRGLPLADTKFNEPDSVDVLLSVEFMARIQAEGFRKSNTQADRPVACNTSFGWIIYGALPHTLKHTHAQVSHMSLIDAQRLSDNLERLWKIDEVSHDRVFTEDELRCREIFEENVTRDETGRYIVMMPIKPDAPQLGKSLKAAMARQFSNERRFRKDPELKANYIKNIQQFIDLDHMELVPPEEIDKTNGVYYMPHHAACPTKFRVVFDGSVKTSSGVSLNDILLNGPRMQDDLTAIIMRFRSYAIALTTDITKMYRQVLVPESQRDLLRIIWREHENEPLRHYRMKRQTYGLKSSSFCCIEALRRCAIDYEKEFPLASKAVLRCFYVDDGTLGADNEDEAETLYHQLNTMLGKGGFPLAKWATNSHHIRSVIGTTANSVDLELFDDNSVLGLKWSVVEDSFKYELAEPIINNNLTKRVIVSEIARLYDPIGWIAPLIITGKILIQDIWRTKCDWDDIVPSHIRAKWIEFCAVLGELSKIAIPRWVGSGSGLRVQIHGFSDASNKAYGVCFYFRVESSAGIKCNLITSKTRVAPLKGMTTPRMELCGATMMAEMCKPIGDTYGVKIADMTFWIDSSIVLHWLSKCPAGMKTFVANRVATAQDETKGAVWKHVRTHDNPADLASRGLNANELLGNSLWFNGPRWLCQDCASWPVSSFVVDSHVKDATAAEQKPLISMAISHREIVPRMEVFNDGKPELLLDRCQTLMKLVHTTARVLRFIRATREKKRYDSIFIDRKEYLDAQNIWIKYHQNNHFANQ